jgi:hypothetical protein
MKRVERERERERERVLNVQERIIVSSPVEAAEEVGRGGRESWRESVSI